MMGGDWWTIFLTVIFHLLSWEIFLYSQFLKEKNLHWMDGSIERYKARLVAKGFTQKYGIDYEETFAPFAKMTIVRTLITVATILQSGISQMDVQNGFLNRDLVEEVYMVP